MPLCRVLHSKEDPVLVPREGYTLFWKSEIRFKVINFLPRQIFLLMQNSLYIIYYEARTILSLLLCRALPHCLLRQHICVYYILSPIFAALK